MANQCLMSLAHDILTTYFSNLFPLRGSGSGCSNLFRCGLSLSLLLGLLRLFLAGVLCLTAYARVRRG